MEKNKCKGENSRKTTKFPYSAKKIGFKCKKNHQTWYFDSSFDTRERHSTYMKVLEYRRLSTRVPTSKYCSTDMEVLAEHKREGTRTCIYIYIGKDCKKNNSYMHCIFHDFAYLCYKNKIQGHHYIYIII